MFKFVKYIFLLVALAVVAAVGYFYFQTKQEKTIDVAPGRITNIESVVQLCTVDLYNEVPVKDTVNNKMIFAIQKQRGSISFDLEKIQVDDSGDTVRIVLGPEIVEVNEATGDNSWEVIDTKGLSIFTSDKLTDEEENLVKRKIRSKSIKRLYQNGTVKRARAEAADNLARFMEMVYNRPVIVTDPQAK